MNIITPEEMRIGVVPGPKLVTLISCRSDEKPNIVTVSYVGQITDRLMYISLRPSRYSNSLIRHSKKFGINYISSNLVKEADYCGIYSGKNTDKLKVTGLTVDDSNLINETSLSLECSLKDIKKIGEHDVFFGKVTKAVKRKEEYDWLYHDNFEYFSKRGSLGKLFEVGR